jgi:hypothetical protein
MKIIFTLMFTLMVSAFSMVKANTNQLNGMLFKVYKHPQCSCCEKWVQHLQQQDATITVVNSEYLSTIKARLGISANYQSCHTAVSQSGYVFEGHVPAKFIQQFLQNPPKNALGLAVPAMPLGAPGMEMGDRFLPYRIMLLNQNGSATLYATVNNAKEQY